MLLSLPKSEGRLVQEGLSSYEPVQTAEVHRELQPVYLRIPVIVPMPLLRHESLHHSLGEALLLLLLLLCRLLLHALPSVGLLLLLLPLKVLMMLPMKLLS